jgi:hypothetical protein
MNPNRIRREHTEVEPRDRSEAARHRVPREGRG